MTSETKESLERLRSLAEFRYALRQFLQFSEGRAVEAGLHPQQHQLMLQIAGAADGVETTISYAAERLGLRHNTVVELSKRCEEAELIRRVQDVSDQRRVLLGLTAKGRRVLEELADDHAQELEELLPTLIKTLSGIQRSSARRGGA